MIGCVLDPLKSLRAELHDRKRRTRRLILIGSYVDSVSQADPVSMTRLMKGLDEFLERGAVHTGRKGTFRP